MSGIGAHACNLALKGHPGLHNETVFREEGERQGKGFVHPSYYSIGLADLSPPFGDTGKSNLSGTGLIAAAGTQPGKQTVAH